MCVYMIQINYALQIENIEGENDPRSYEATKAVHQVPPGG